VPGPIKLASGTFRILPQQLSFAEVQAELMDAALHSTGDLYLFGQSFSKARLVLDGNVCPGATRRLFSLIHLPSAIHAPSSFRLSQAELTWERGGAKAFKGNIACQDGLNLSGEVTVAPGELAVKNLLIQDKTSRARLGLVLKKKALDARFSGNLTRETTAKIGSSHLFPTGWVKGDMEIHFRKDQPGLSTARGRLEGEDLELPLGLPLPLFIERYSVDAARNEIRVKAANVLWEGNQIGVNGDVHFSPSGVHLDLEVSTGGIDLERLLTLFSQDRETLAQVPGGKDTGKDRAKKADDAWDLPVTGLVRLHSDHLTYRQFTWSPVRATISFDRKSARIGVSEAGLCGISTSGVLEVAPQRAVLHFHSVSKEEPIDEVLYCLLGTKTYLTGKLDLDANMRGQGTISELVRSLNGSLRLSAKDGRIYRWNLLAKIFAVLSVTEIFRGRIPDLAKSGLAYHSLGITGEVRNGRFVVAEAVLDSASVDLVAQGDIDLSTRQVNLLVLVAPFRNIDLIIGSIPVVGYILGKNLFAVPFRVTGDPDNPDVSVFPISAVGSGMLTTMKRILTLPVELVQPLIPGDGGK
jgi:hypothetical protein